MPSRTLLSRLCDFFLLPYTCQYRSMRVDIRKLTTRLMSRWRFSSRALNFFPLDLLGEFVRAVDEHRLLSSSLPPSDFVNAIRLFVDGHLRSPISRWF